MNAFLPLVSCLLLTSGMVGVAIAAPVTSTKSGMANGIVEVSFDSDGTFSITDAKSGDKLLSNGRFGLPLGRRGGVETMRIEEVEDVLGHGKRMVLEVNDGSEVRYTASARHLFSYTLYEDSPALVCGFGMKTPNFLSLRVREASPLGSGLLFDGAAWESAMTLNGGAGAAATGIEPGLSRHAANSLTLTGKMNGIRRTVVWGGLKSREFGAYASLDNGVPSFRAEDPVGKLVDEDQTWMSEELFYLDVHTREPFEALERYGAMTRIATGACPNVYDFPVLCGWSVGALSNLPNVNTSAKLVEELGFSNKCGLTKYTKASLRLEPDKYHLDTEQGWWDDEHFRKFGHLVDPYPTVRSWCDAMKAANGVPYTYMQLGMPSDDFARQHPQWMLFNDASEVDKVTPGKKMRNGQKHPHHQPYVSYDYTDKEFAAHFLGRWKKIHEDGVHGVKVDYPETGWRPEGGFDDRHATTNSAYRRPFELLREAFGKDGLIDERNLGESGRPCLEVTTGVVDTQRTWGDSKDYEPAMISISGLRWYKNRTVYNYYPDTKAVHDVSPDIRRSLLTMVFLTSGRLDLATSFSLFTLEITRDVSRTYPHYREAKSARPLDAFTGVKDPQVYDLELTPDWHQIALYNTGSEKALVFTAISGDRADNAVGLDPAAEYHAYEFWTDTYLGRLSGKARVGRELDPNCCAMVSLRKAEPHPQVVSTDRHLLQGWMDLANVRWDSATKTLSGTAHVIGGDPFTIVIAGNGAKAVSAAATGGKAVLVQAKDGLSRITLTSDANADVQWSVKYE